MTPDSTLLERFVGNYSVEGRTPDGKSYRGSMQVQRKGAFLHAEAKLDPLGVRYGLAMPFAGRLVMAFGAKDKVEIGAYRIEGKNVIGTWVPPGATDADFARCGREVSLVESPGVWKIQKAHAVDQSAYTGTVRLIPNVTAGPEPTLVQMKWSLHDGEYQSFALAYADAVYSTFNLAKGEPHGIAVYAVEGNMLKGTWISDSGMTPGSEMLKR